MKELKREITFNIEVVDVDEKGFDKEGDDFENYGSDFAVEAGWISNNPVLKRYPNGDLAIGNKIMVSPEGIEKIRELMEKDKK